MTNNHDEYSRRIKATQETLDRLKEMYLWLVADGGAFLHDYGETSNNENRVTPVDPRIREQSDT